MSTVEAIEVLREVKGILVQHDTFSYLLKSPLYLCGSGEKLKRSITNSGDDHKQWSVVVFKNCSDVPDLFGPGYHHIRVCPKDDKPSHFKLLLLNDYKKVCLCVKSQDPSNCVEVIMNEVSSLEPTSVLLNTSIEIGQIESTEDKMKLIEEFSDEFSDDTDDSLDYPKEKILKKPANLKEGSSIAKSFSLTHFIIILFILMLTILSMLFLAKINRQFSLALEKSSFLRVDVQKFKTYNTDKLFFETITSVYIVAMRENIPELASQCAEFLKTYTNEEDVLNILERAVKENNKSLWKLGVNLLPTDSEDSPLFNSTKWHKLVERSANLTARKTIRLV